MKFIYLLIALLGAISLPAQQTVNADTTIKQYSPAVMQEDFSVLRKALQTIYPSLYRYSDSVNITAFLDGQSGLLNRPMEEREFFKIIALTCARLRDEHLIAKPSPGYVSKANAFPFTFKIINRRFYIVKSAFNPSPVKPGSELISINGRSMEEILNLMLPAIPADGYIQTFRLRHLEDYSTTQEESMFDLLYPVFVEQASSFRLEYIAVENPSVKQTVTVDGLDKDAYKKFYKERLALDTALKFRYLKKDVAYLKISSFLRWHRRIFKQNFDSLYAVIFNELKIKKTAHLILDLRNNEGGDNTGEALITYLLQKTYRHFDHLEKRYVGLPEVSSYIQNGNDLYLADSIFYKNSTGNYEVKPAFYQSWSPLLLEVQPKENHFSGQLTVLANGASGSMASVVCSFLKGNNRAIFVGEESGGAMEGPTARSSAQLMLPNTRISISVPLTKTVNAVPYTKGRGVIPDYWIEPSVEDLLHGVDTELNFALKLAGQK